MIPLYGVLILSCGSGILAAILVHFVVSPYLKKKILREVYSERDEKERTLSGTSCRGVSFSPTLSNAQVNTDKQDITGKLIYSPHIFHSQKLLTLSRTSLKWPQSWGQRKVASPLWGGRGVI